MNSTTSPQPKASSKASPPAQPQPDAVSPQTAEPAPGAPSADPTTTGGAVARLAASGVVNFYRVRANGSARFLPYLAQGTEAREVAEWAALQVEEGRSVAWLAEDAGVSRATVRRALAALDLAEDIEAGEYDELVTDDVDAVFVGDADADDATVGKGIGPVTDVTNFDFHVVTEDKR